MKQTRAATGSIAAIGILIIILDGQTAFEGIQKGMELCLKTVIPSLFPFFFFSNLLIATLWGSDSVFLHFLGGLFHMQKGAESILIPAFLGGYPTGAQTIAQAYKAGNLSRGDAERLLAFCNNAGPAFIFGMVAPSFSSPQAGWVIWISQILGAWTCSQIIQGTCYSDVVFSENRMTLTGCMTSAIRSMGNVCGWVIVFRMILLFCEKWFLASLSPTLRVFLTGMIELSNGCCMLSAIRIPLVRLLVANILLSVGGLCVTMQTLSATGDLSMRKYFTGKIIQIITSILISVILWGHQFVLIMPMLLLIVLYIAKIEKHSSISMKHVV